MFGHKSRLARPVALRADRVLAAPRSPSLQGNLLERASKMQARVFKAWITFLLCKCAYGIRGWDRRKASGKRGEGGAEHLSGGTHLGISVPQHQKVVELFRASDSNFLHATACHNLRPEPTPPPPQAGLPMGGARCGIV